MADNGSLADTCAFPDEPCLKPAVTRGYCHRHYKLLGRHGRLEVLHPHSAPDAKCKEVVCDRSPNGGHGWCQEHYDRQRRTGQANRQRFPAGGPCQAAEDCPEPAVTRGLCRRHYDNMRRHGAYEPEGQRRSAEGPCQFDGCAEPVYAKGLCNAHYQQRRRGIELHAVNARLIAEDAVCTAIEGCPRPVWATDMCRTHYYQVKEGRVVTMLAPLPTNDGLCSFTAGCRKPAEDEGLCLSHLLMSIDGRTLVPLVLQVSTQRTIEMGSRGVSWCSACQQELPLTNFLIDNTGKRAGLPRSRCRRCSGMITRAKKFNRSLGFIARLFEFQNFCCDICGDEHKNDAGLHLDHDHNCPECSGEDQVCGQCVRGLLCWSCNGLLVGWYETKGKRLFGEYEPIERYLKDPPARRMG